MLNKLFTDGKQVIYECLISHFQPLNKSFPYRKQVICSFQTSHFSFHLFVVLFILAAKVVKNN